MRIAHVASSMSRSGAGVVSALIGQLRALTACDDIEAAVFAAEDRWSVADRDNWAGIDLTVGATHGPAAFAWAPGLAGSVSAFRPAVIHRHGLWTHAGIAASRAAAACGARIVVSPHGMLDPWAMDHARAKKKLALLMFEGRALRQADCIHALNDAELNGIRGAGLTNPVCVVPNGIALPTHKQLCPAGQPRDPETRTLLFFGRLHPKKGLEALIEGWRLFGEVLPGRKGWRLRIVGWSDDGYDTVLRDRIFERGLSDTVHIDGPVFGTERWRILGESRAFILPSVSEGLPMAVLEAWAAGLPVIMTEACNLQAGFASGAALRTGPEPEAIARSLGTLADLDGDRLKNMGQAGRHLVMARFSWDRAADKIADVYRWLCMGGRAARPCRHQPASGGARRVTLPVITEPDARDRVRRLAWTIMWWILYRPTPVWCFRWRCLVLRLFGASIAYPAYPYPGTRIRAPWNLAMEAGSCLADRVDCYNVAPVRLAARALVSQKTHLCTASHDFDDPGFPLVGAPITIGAGAWVAADCFVGPGVSVGNEAVALARSVVVADVPAGTVVAGNPARIVRQRGQRRDRVASGEAPA